MGFRVGGLTPLVPRNKKKAVKALSANQSEVSSSVFTVDSSMAEDRRLKSAANDLVAETRKLRTAVSKLDKVQSYVGDIQRIAIRAASGEVSDLQRDKLDRQIQEIKFKIQAELKKDAIENFGLKDVSVASAEEAQKAREQAGEALDQIKSKLSEIKEEISSVDSGPQSVNSSVSAELITQNLLKKD